MADLVAIAGSALAVLVVGLDKLAAWKRSGAPPAPAREAMVPTPSSQPSTSALNLDVPALVGRIMALDTALAAQAQQIEALQEALDEERQGRGEIREMLAELRGEARARREARARGGGGDERESR